MDAGGYVLFSLRGCRCGLSCDGAFAVAVRPLCDVADVTDVDLERDAPSELIDGVAAEEEIAIRLSDSRRVRPLLAKCVMLLCTIGEALGSRTGSPSRLGLGGGTAALSVDAARFA